MRLPGIFGVFSEALWIQRHMITPPGSSSTFKNPHAFPYTSPLTGPIRITSRTGSDSGIW
ncbi:protein of unknown function [Methylocaldum szegediense]|uniref:Uncharacterized protein n=1 Tax=Methylocaldum szegediense TaxID=73780 RepID=A0ABN8X4H7_9GAMM|nr:protein of unknown function [Methylocaldum szegediense]